MRPGHPHLGRHGAASQLSRVWLLVLAILIHNFPEGMAVGVAFSGSDPSAGVPIVTAIAIQNLPEGLVVALALRTIDYRRERAVLIAAATGLAEPLGAAAASALLSGSPVLYPFGLALAAGAMLFVVSHEIIPETHRNGHQMPATLGVMGGFALMMVLDNCSLRKSGREAGTQADRISTVTRHDRSETAVTCPPVILNP